MEDHVGTGKLDERKLQSLGKVTESLRWGKRGKDVRVLKCQIKFN